MSAQRILVVDDDPAVLRVLTSNLAARGYAVTGAESGEDGLSALGRLEQDLVILDLLLPGQSGLSVAEAIRAESDVPILVLSARGEERTKVRALDLGADDYLTKPFGIEELLARVRALLRRHPVSLHGPAGPIRVSELRLDPAAHAVSLRGQPLDLTPREYDVLAYLMSNAGKLVTHRLLLGQVWGSEYGAETQYLRVFINRLRRKIEDDPAHPRYILTEPGVGYRLQYAATESGGVSDTSP